MYKNGYKSSSWTSLMYDRLQAAKSLHSTKGVSVLAIDDAQFRELSFVAQAVGFEALGVFCIRANPSGRPMQTGYSVSHEYNIVLGASGTAAIGRMRPTESQQARFNQTDDKGSFEWRNLRREGSNSDRSARPALYYPIYLRLPDSIRVPKMSWILARDLGQLKSSLKRVKLSFSQTMMKGRRKHGGGSGERLLQVKKIWQLG